MNRIARRAALLAAFAVLAPAWGQGTTSGPAAASGVAPVWPTRPVTIVAAYPPGGVADQMARVLANELSKRIGQTVTVENRVGASGMIGAAHVAKSAPDGHTLLMGAMAEVVFTPHMHDRMAYQPDKDLAPVAMAVRFPFMLVAHPSVPVKSTADVITLAKKSPGTYTYATGGNGSVQHIAMEMFSRLAGIQMRHIPYKGVTPALNDVLANQVHMMFAGFPPAMAHVQAGKLTPLGLSTRERLPTEPGIPSVSETPGLEKFDLPVWVGLFAPSATSPAVLDRIHRETVAVFGSPAIRANIEKGGMAVSDEPRAAFASFIGAEYTKYQRVIREAGIKEQ